MNLSKDNSLIEIKFKNTLLAIIVKDSYCNDGVSFVTPKEAPQQLAYMSHKTGVEIKPHIHKSAERVINSTQEVLVLKKGKLRVDFYESNKKYIMSHILNKGDVIILMRGGHGFHVIEEVEMIEVKQGPYIGQNDKVRFSGVPMNHDQLIFSDKS